MTGPLVPRFKNVCGGEWSLDFNPFINISHPQLVSKIPGIGLLFSMYPSAGPFVHFFLLEAAFDFFKNWKCKLG